MKGASLSDVEMGHCEDFHTGWSRAGWASELLCPRCAEPLCPYLPHVPNASAVVCHEATSYTTPSPGFSGTGDSSLVFTPSPSVCSELEDHNYPNCNLRLPGNLGIKGWRRESVPSAFSLYTWPLAKQTMTSWDVQFPAQMK